MVQEFTELQGIVGGLYAGVQGEAKEVANAIYDHYKPVGLDDQLPRGIVGAIVSLADKIHAVVGGFAAGLEPTGSSDPFGLRRQGNGIVRVLVEFSLPIVLTDTVITALHALGKDWHGSLDPVAKFFEERISFYLERAAGCRYDTVRAVIAKGWDIPVEAVKRAQAVERIRDSEDYVALAVAAKRTRNILKKSASSEDYESGQLDPSLLNQEAEVELYRAYGSIFNQVTEGGILSRDYDTILTLTARLRPAIDRFFDQVLVMHEDPSVRRNRLRLLALLDEKVFSRVADLSEIEGNLDVSTSRAARK
jgi:glycyl-tRNA synthetase beta chain